MCTLIVATLSYKKIAINTKVYLISISYLLTSIFLFVEYYGTNLDHRPLILSLPFFYLIDYYIYKSNSEKIKSIFNLNLDKN